MDWDLDWDDVAEAFLGTMLALLVMWFVMMPLMMRSGRRRRMRLGR